MTNSVNIPNNVMDNQYKVVL